MNLDHRTHQHGNHNPHDVVVADGTTWDYRMRCACGWDSGPGLRQDEAIKDFATHLRADDDQRAVAVAAAREARGTR
jgi:hypothetical protein